MLSLIRNADACDKVLSAAYIALSQMLARSRLVGTKNSRPHLKTVQSFFPWAGKIKQMHIVLLFPLVVQWLLFTRFGVEPSDQRQIL